MPLDKPALAVGSGPSSVHDARMWVLDALDDIGRTELSECAGLGVSELVTNAVLHAAAPISVRVRGTRDHPRIEVLDASVEPPVLPGSEPESPEDDEENLLVTFGRGLGIVARCAIAWGADIEDDGKVTWMVPARRPHEEDGVPGVITGIPRARTRRTTGQIAINVLGVPLRSYLDFQRHYRELRREVRLLALAHESSYPLAKSLSDLFGSLEREMREGIGSQQIQDALDAGRDATDLVVTTHREAAAAIGRFLELLDLADSFCREERLLSLARTPHQVRFQRWFFGEFVRQLSGQAPSRWREGDVRRRRRARA